MSARNTRRLKVYYGYQGNSQQKHPVIRLAGKYLSKWDFKIGDRVEVTINEGSVVISKLQDSKAEIDA